MATTPTGDRERTVAAVRAHHDQLARELGRHASSVLSYVDFLSAGTDRARAGSPSSRRYSGRTCAPRSAACSTCCAGAASTSTTSTGSRPTTAGWTPRPARNAPGGRRAFRRSSPTCAHIEAEEFGLFPAALATLDGAGW
jgi:hypothetical protein